MLSHFTKLKNRLMPYLFAGAVDVHASGRPEMCAMSLAFPNDPNCAYLDRQYMLGDSLLVAPVFNDQGTVQFYVPEGGTWTDIQSGEKFPGGKWYTRQYDYFSLPLLAKPGAVIAMGAVEDKTVYDYADGVTLHIYELQNGQSVTRVIYQADLQQAMSVNVQRLGKEVRISWSGTGSNPLSSVIWSGDPIATASGAVMHVENEVVQLVPESAVQEMVLHLA